MKKIISIISILVVILIILITHFSIRNLKSNKTYKTLDDMKGKTIGVQTGTIYGDIVNEKIKNVKLKYYDNYNDLVSALENKEIDGFALDEPTIKYIIKEHPSIDFLGTKLNQDYFGYALNKNRRGNDILKKLNSYIEEITNSGLMQEYIDIWFGEDNSKKVVEDYTKLSGNDTIIYAVEPYNEPFVYYDNNGNLTGFEIALIADFCMKNNYALNIKTYDFDELLKPDERIDIRSSSISITDERKDIFNFTTPTYENSGIIAVLKNDINKNENNNEIKKVSDLDYGKLGILSGTVFEDVISTYVSNIQPLYYDDIDVMFNELEEGYIDGIIIDDNLAKYNVNKRDNLEILDQLLSYDKYAFIFNKNENKIYNEFNDYITKIKKDGTLEALDNFWVNNKIDESKINFDINDLENINGELNVIIPTMIVEPFTYKIGDKLVGYEIEILYNFCKEYGYSIKINDFSYYDMFNKMAEGGYDIGLGDITITYDRQKIIKYSKETYVGGVVAVVNKNKNK